MVLARDSHSGSGSRGCARGCLVEGHADGQRLRSPFWLLPDLRRAQRVSGGRGSSMGEHGNRRGWGHRHRRWREQGRRRGGGHGRRRGRGGEGVGPCPHLASDALPHLLPLPQLAPQPLLLPILLTLTPVHPMLALSTPTAGRTGATLVLRRLQCGAVRAGWSQNAHRYARGVPRPLRAAPLRDGSCCLGRCETEGTRPCLARAPC